MRKRIKSRRKGQAVVEFALVATLLVTLMVIFLSLADAIHMKAVADNAVREAGRRAIFNYDGDVEAQQLLDQMLADNKTMTGATCTGTIDPPTQGPSLLLWTNQSRVVRVTCEVPLLIIGQTFLGRASLHVESHATFNLWQPGSVFELGGL